MDNSITERLQQCGATMLVADDEPVIREHLKKIGEMLGFKVHTAGDGAEAWESYKMLFPNLVILDVYMPHMNGLTLMNKIKELDGSCPVLLITGYSHYKQLVQNNLIKPDGFVSKPFSLQTIVNEILKLVKKNGIAK